MISEKMKGFVQGSSVIRAMFEEGKKLAAIYGEDKVYDFSLGNPNVPAPEQVNQMIKDIVDEELSVMVHGYMNNSGYEDVRAAIADSLNRRFDTKFRQENIVMTVGAAGGLNVILKSLLNPRDEVIVFAPFFGEYRAYVENYDGILLVVPADTKDFQLNLNAFESMITPGTRAVIINNPNNPSGVLYSEQTIKNLAEIMNRKQKEYGTEIFLISDEPYRELVYDGAGAVYLPKYYDNTIVAYSYSKSLSLPGERIGYLVIPDEAADSEEIQSAANVATRILGFVNAPSLMQRVIGRCVKAGVTVDIEPYDRNRKLIYENLKRMGFECVRPEGAFYLFVKTPTEDEMEFVNAAKKYNVLLVPGSAFHCPGYVRISYCVSEDTIRNSLPEFEKLAKEFINR
ncbi:MAG: pyridoxal phosphate-dependent aminotransferase [Lachnospiraceae bacterium]|nr:pyridoxal phosphate-dependent aminotransferase [Lachnospiraceae bacterium]